MTFARVQEPQTGRFSGRPGQAGRDGCCHGVATTIAAKPTGCTSHHRSCADHPHFHVRHAEGAAKIRIDPVEVIDSTLPTRQLRIALAWAEFHQVELLDN
ncbi:MAG TPA: DUF4160 domain-containing protein [Solirubrobacteraceae bacterium]